MGAVVSRPGVRLLSAGEIRDIAGRLGVRPTKRLGQNFVVEQGTVRQIAALAAPRGGDVVLEVGPGLGSLTLALLEVISAASRGSGVDGTAGATGAAGAAGAAGGVRVIPTRVVAVEIDPVLAAELPRTVADRAPDVAGQFRVVRANALDVVGPGSAPGPAGGAAGGGWASRRPGGGRRDRGVGVGLPWVPTVLAANLPYNVAVPVVLHLLAEFPSLARGVVMVQAEVADRMCAGPGSRVYGAPSAKLAWFAAARPAGTVPRSVFWPVPNVDSKLVAFTRHDPPPTVASRQEVFGVIDAAFGQRRKTLRAALAGWAGSAAEAERLLRAAGVDPGARGEALTIAEFARIAQASRLR
jgi:16S rRNA (adenine1518-N6/adenine1519-N6)-dimethyltransferase